jgi:hypothetical protein
MITWLRHDHDGEKRKLLLSVGTAFLTRIPGAIGLVWFLPLLRFSMGTDLYSSLLSAIALGGAASFLAGGFHVVGRRMIGESYGDSNQAAEADAFMSTLVVNVIALAIALGIVGAYCWISHATINYLIVAGLSVFQISVQMFDNVRSAYNENYVTSILLIIFQSIAYAIGFLVPESREYVVLAILVLGAPYMITSIVTCAMLLRDKPYLMAGTPLAITLVARQGFMLAVADGFLFATLSLSVVWLQRTASVDTAAWFATIVRLFQTFLVPISLLMLPLSSYIRLRWNDTSMMHQQRYTKATVAIGVVYGAIVSLALFAASQFYVGRMLHLPVPHDVSIFFLFGAIVAYRSYSSVAYVVLNETMHLTTWITVAVGVGVTVGAVASLAVDPLHAIDYYAVAAGASILAVMLWNAARFVRPNIVTA